MVTDAAPRRLPLRDLHAAQGAKWAPFAGWEMPIQYGPGVMAEHLHTRDAAGLFDVSHMGQVVLHPTGSVADLALALERLTPTDVAGIAPGRQRYALWTDAAGGILDDAMIANRGADLFVVVNAGRREHDLGLLRDGLAGAAEVEELTDRALLAVQGPGAAEAITALIPGAAAMRFMDWAALDWSGHALWLTRSGYTGEDGFEISVPDPAAADFAAALLAQPGVALAGLGARDSLRLEAGLPLYGHDIDTTTSPVEAALGWSIGKARRAGGARAGGYPGADRVARELAEGPARRRVGLRPDGRAPMREGVVLSHDGQPVGTVTSGGFGPSVGAPVAMGYVDAAHAATGTALDGDVRGRALPVTVADLPFVPSRFHR